MQRVEKYNQELQNKPKFKPISRKFFNRNKKPKEIYSTGRQIMEVNSKMNAEDGNFDLEKFSRYQPKFTKPKDSRSKQKRAKRRGNDLLTPEKSGKGC